MEQPKMKKITGGTIDKIVYEPEGVVYISVTESQFSEIKSITSSIASTLAFFLFGIAGNAIFTLVSMPPSSTGNLIVLLCILVGSLVGGIIFAIFAVIAYHKKSKIFKDLLRDKEARQSLLGEQKKIDDNTKYDLQNLFTRDNSNVAILDESIYYNGVGMAYTRNHYKPELEISFRITLLDIIRKGRITELGEGENVDRFHDIRLHFFPNGDFRRHITIIFPWEHISDTDRTSLQCRIAYQITDEALQREEEWWPEHSRNIDPMPIVYTRDRFELKSYSLNVKLEEEQLIIHSEDFDNTVRTITVPMTKFQNIGLGNLSDYVIGLQSCNSIAQASEVRIQQSNS